MAGMSPEERARDCLDFITRHRMEMGDVDPDRVQDRITAAIRDAVSAEREACAKVAESFDRGTDDLQRGGDGGTIAAAIRARQETASTQLGMSNLRSK
jgi:hypothetical protein